MEQIKKVKPRDYAIEQIRWYIEENKLGPHAKLPGERDMCDMWGVNRSTLRSAIKRLVEENILYSETGSGTYVAPPKFRMNLQDAKSTTESMRGTGNFLWTEVVDSFFLEADEYLSDKLCLNKGEKVFCLIRIRRKNNIPFRIEKSYINYSLCEGIENHNFTDESLFKILKSYGLTLDTGNEDIGIVYAGKDEAQLLQIDEGDHLFGIRGIISDINGKIVEYFDILTRADQVQFTSILKI